MVRPGSAWRDGSGVPFGVLLGLSTDRKRSGAPLSLLVAFLLASVLSQATLHECDKTDTDRSACLGCPHVPAPDRSPLRAGREEAPVRCLFSGSVSVFGTAERLHLLPGPCSDVQESLLLTLSK